MSAGRHALAVLWSVLTPAQRRRCLWLQGVSLLMASSTVLALASVMTFLALLEEPSLAQSHVFLNGLARLLQASQREFLLWLAGGFIALLALCALVNVFGLRAMGRFAYSVGDRVRERLFAHYLHRDYAFHARTAPARLMDSVLQQSDRVIIMLLNGQLLITNVVLTVLVVAAIAVVNLAVATAGVLLVAGSYLLFYRFLRRRVTRNGQVQADLGAERLAVIEQAFRGIKYLLHTRAQPSFERRFTHSTRALSRTLADTQFIGQFPRFALECVAGAALIAVAASVSVDGGGGSWLAQLGFIGFAGFRLLPAFQQMYNAVVTIRATRPSLDCLGAELLGAALPTSPPAPPESVELRRGIELCAVSFRFSHDSPLLLENVCLRIEAGTAVGITGASGSGKTTLVDLVLGLLEPAGGRIEVDGEVLDRGRATAWRRSIGYVPQDVMILDASVRENIAFGVEAGDVDDVRVREAARQAGASEFIEAIPGGYAGRLTGAGGGLSGGQRQRLGIARALYRQPSLLVLDEATNALDAETERAIVDRVIRRRGARTVLVVTHGAAVINACDRVYELRQGSLHQYQCLEKVG